MATILYMYTDNQSTKYSFSHNLALHCLVKYQLTTLTCCPKVCLFELLQSDRIPFESWCAQSRISNINFLLHSFYLVESKPQSLLISTTYAMHNYMLWPGICCSVYMSQSYIAQNAKEYLRILVFSHTAIPTWELNIMQKENWWPARQHLSCYVY